MTGDQELRVATLARLELLERFVASAVADMSPGPTDPLAGMFISEAQVQRLLAGRPESAGDLGRLDAVLSGWGRHVGIDDVDVDLLVVAAAPDIDHRFERLFGYLNDDATLRRATTGLALRLAACDATRPEFRARLSDDAPLVRLGLVEIEERGRPFLTRSLRVPDRVVMALLG
ncbi:MAG: ATP-binding protein, partial [Ilumatobacteraceae bacterium]